MKRSAIPVTKTLAITFRHGENKKLVNGDVIRLQSYQNQKTNVATRIVLINEILDLIVLQSESEEFCDRDLILEAVEPEKGMRWATPFIMDGLITYHFRQELLQVISSHDCVTWAQVAPFMAIVEEVAGVKTDICLGCELKLNWFLIQRTTTVEQHHLHLVDDVK
ncbi:hypothetical protein FO519_004143 [Halicephalobus sp. NKZ332]|nr:hypothetical protein FO519_004143 [Halicephalobus sp. NKZ332]